MLSEAKNMTVKQIRAQLFSGDYHGQYEAAEGLLKYLRWSLRTQVNEGDDTLLEALLYAIANPLQPLAEHAPLNPKWTLERRLISALRFLALKGFTDWRALQPVAELCMKNKFSMGSDDNPSEFLMAIFHNSHFDGLLNFIHTNSESVIEWNPIDLGYKQRMTRLLGLAINVIGEKARSEKLEDYFRNKAVNELGILYIIKLSENRNYVEEEDFYCSDTGILLDEICNTLASLGSIRSLHHVMYHIGKNGFCSDLVKKYLLDCIPLASPRDLSDPNFYEILSIITCNDGFLDLNRDSWFGERMAIYSIWMNAEEYD